MLAEANLHREWAIEETTRPFADQDGVVGALDEAQEILREALLLIDPDSDRERRLRANLLVERAATLGVQCRRLLEEGQPDRARGIFNELRRDVHRRSNRIRAATTRLTSSRG